MPATMPRDCTFSASDWQILAAFWHPVALASEIGGHPVAARLLDQDLVIYRTRDGISVAADLCVHRGAPLSLGKLVEDRLVCAYHGYCYDANGRCTHIPAHPDLPIPGKLHLRIFRAAERYGWIWVCLDGESANEIPPLPGWEDPANQRVHVPALPWAASAGRQVESFCDVAHFAFVHPTTFAVTDARVPRYEVSSTADGVHAEFISQVGNVTDPSAANHVWRRIYDLTLPFVACLLVYFPNGGKLRILNVASPESARKTRVFCLVLRDFDHDQPVEDLIDFQKRVYGEDQAIVERQNPEDLPVDLDEEVHVRADLTSIHYRRGLKRLGLGRKFTA